MTSNLDTKINIAHAEISIDSDGIVQAQAVDYNYSLDDIKVIHDTAIKLSGNTKTLLLLISTPFTQIDDDARHFLSSPVAGKNFIAKAYVITSLAQRIILNFVFRVKGTTVPSKFFTDKNEAIAWLKSHV